MEKRRQVDTGSATVAELQIAYLQATPTPEQKQREEQPMQQLAAMTKQANARKARNVVPFPGKASSGDKAVRAARAAPPAPSTSILEPSMVIRCSSGRTRRATIRRDGHEWQQTFMRGNPAGGFGLTVQRRLQCMCEGDALIHSDAPEHQQRLWASSDRYHQTVLQFPLPTIAAVNGPALAGGFDLAVMCDLRVASTTARFAHPERTFGDVVYGPLHDLVGGAVARDLTLGGRELEAGPALAVHLVNEVVEPARLMDAVLATVARVTVAPREVLMRTKAKALRRAGLSRDSATLEL
jgi:hypothetical protein